MSVRSRFAPSPTGPLHLGHAYSALLAQDIARRAGGVFLLRIEDIDRARARPEWEAAIIEDLAWLGLTWAVPVLRQSDRLPAYGDTLDRLWALGLLYPCTCTRRDIAEALAAPQEGAPVQGPDGPVYPGTCRPAPDAPPPTGPRPRNAVLRLDLGRAIAATGTAPLTFRECGDDPRSPGEARQIAPESLPATVGDVVLSRRDMGTSYHLAVVVDDAFQQVTDVVRGADLAPATSIHLLLQRLLGLPVPAYHHHRLIRDAEGRRLAKRDDARALRLFRAEGATPQDIRRMVGFGA